MINRLRQLWREKNYKELQQLYALGKWKLSKDEQQAIETAINTIPLEVYAADVLDWKVTTNASEQKRQQSASVPDREPERGIRELFPRTDSEKHKVYEEKKGVHRRGVQSV